MATQKDVANLAGVSFITVSRVINNKGNVKEDTRQRVLEAVKQLNYYPNSFGRGLTGNEVGTIAVLAPLPPNVEAESTSYYRRLLIGIERCGIRQGCDILLSTQRDTEGNFDFLKPFYERKADGLILLGAVPDENQYGRIEEDRIPCVIVGDHDSGRRVSSVDSDNSDGMRQLTEHLVDEGHRRIAYLHVEKTVRNTAERLESFLSVLKEHDISLPAGNLIYGDFTKNSGVKAIQILLDMPVRPTALVAGTDLMAIGALEAARTANLRVPGDLTIVGFDGHEITSYTNPRLATVVQNLEHMGEAAAEMLVRRIRGDNEPYEHRIIPVVFEPRESIGPPNPAL
ncbi:MAG: LacI family DNA-binding transcriptional regulator [Spirochaetaceae bacterium]|nr:LacI family DNA-binding transcriptional regulator [Spirochaetaceae bacterium]